MEWKDITDEDFIRFLRRMLLARTGWLNSQKKGLIHRCVLGQYTLLDRLAVHYLLMLWRIEMLSHNFCFVRTQRSKSASNFVQLAAELPCHIILNCSTNIALGTEYDIGRNLMHYYQQWHPEIRVELACYVNVVCILVSYFFCQYWRTNTTCPNDKTIYHLLACHVEDTDLSYRSSSRCDSFYVGHQKSGLSSRAM